MGYATTAMILVFCITIGVYVASYDASTGTYDTTILNSYILMGLMNSDYTPSTAIMLTWMTIIAGIIALTAVTGIQVLSTGTNFSVIYTVPALLVSGLLFNIMIFPTSAIVNSGMPWIFQLFLITIVNMLMLVGILGFIRGYEP